MNLITDATIEITGRANSDGGHDVKRTIIGTTTSNSIGFGGRYAVRAGFCTGCLIRCPCLPGS